MGKGRFSSYWNISLKIQLIIV